MIEAVNTSETSVSFHQTTQRSIPVYSHVHTRHREDLKPHNCYVLRIIALSSVVNLVAMFGTFNVLKLFRTRLSIIDSNGHQMVQQFIFISLFNPSGNYTAVSL
jgi:hypothetical protein